MTTVMILGANGGTAKLLIQRLLNETQDQLILYLRNAQRLRAYQDNPRVQLYEGDTLDQAALATAMKPADIIYSNVGGVDLAKQTRSVLEVMTKLHKNRLILMSALGARHEVKGKFGEWNEEAIAAYLPGFRESASLLDQSDIDFTELRPSWLTDQDDIDYDVIELGEPFVGTEVSRASVADMAFKIIQNPSQYQRKSIGLSKPHTEGAKPRWL